MTILRQAFLGSLRIVVFGSLKFGLFVYALFLSDAALTGSAREGVGSANKTKRHALYLVNRSCS